LGLGFEGFPPHTHPPPPPKTHRLPNGVTPGNDTCQFLFHKCVTNKYDPRDFKSFSSKEGHISFISLILLLDEWVHPTTKLVGKLHLMGIFFFQKMLTRSPSSLS